MEQLLIDDRSIELFDSSTNFFSAKIEKKRISKESPTWQN
jgi:hypothetical protein